jgi:hypothetical protein
MKLYRVNGVTADQLRLHTSEEILDDLSETQDAVNTLTDLVEGGEFEEAQDCVGQILQHLQAVQTFINEKVTN